MEQLINFCIDSTEEDFFKYLMLVVALEKEQQEIQNLLDKYDNNIRFGDSTNRHSH